jgi:hypothetical protein
LFISLAYASLPIPQPNISDSIFVNGPWWNRYNYHGMWNGPFQHFMSFNPYNNTIEGYGVDNVGEFVFNGYYSRNTLQITIVQSYKVHALVLVMNKFDVASNSIRFFLRGQLRNFLNRRIVFQNYQYMSLNWRCRSSASIYVYRTDLIIYRNGIQRFLSIIHFWK